MSGWAELYGTNEKTVRRWTNRGREADPPELPPLAAPHEMELWYVRHHKQECPEKLKRSILQVAEKMAIASPVDAQDGTSAPLEIVPPPPAFVIASAPPAPGGNSLSIDDLESHAKAEYLRAYSEYLATRERRPVNPESNEYLVWQRDVRAAKSVYEDERENFNGFLSKVTRIRAEHGKFWSPDIVKSTLTEILSPLASSWRRQWKSRREDLPPALAARCPRLASAFAAIPQSEWEDFTDSTLDEDFAALQSGSVFEAIETATETASAAA